MQVVGSGSVASVFPNGRLEFTATAPTAEATVLRRLIIASAPRSNDWSAQVDVHLGAVSATGEQYAGLSLAVMKSADHYGPIAQANHMGASIERPGGTPSRSFSSDLRSYYSGTNHAQNTGPVANGSLVL